MPNTLPASDNVTVANNNSRSVSILDFDIVQILLQSSQTFYKCKSVQQTTWSGYQLLDNLSNLFSTQLTTGLEIKGYTPNKGEIYSSDTQLRIQTFYNKQITKLTINPGGDPIQLQTGESVIISSSVHYSDNTTQQLQKVGGTFVIDGIDITGKVEGLLITKTETGYKITLDKNVSSSKSFFVYGELNKICSYRTPILQIKAKVAASFSVTAAKYTMCYNWLQGDETLITAIYIDAYSKKYFPSLSQLSYSIIANIDGTNTNLLKLQQKANGYIYLYVDKNAANIEGEYKVTFTYNKLQSSINVTLTQSSLQIYAEKVIAANQVVEADYVLVTQHLNAIYPKLVQITQDEALQVISQDVYQKLEEKEIDKVYFLTGNQP